MSKDEIQQILATVLPKRLEICDPPSEADWTQLSARFGCTFPDEFRSFIDLMTIFRFPGEIFGAAREENGGESAIAIIYDQECKYATWDRDMIPFYGIGNGEYFCINRTKCPDSPVYYRYLERESFEEISHSFEQWIRGLPEFLD